MKKRSSVAASGYRRKPCATESGRKGPQRAVTAETPALEAGRRTQLRPGIGLCDQCYEPRWPQTYVGYGDMICLDCLSPAERRRAGVGGNSDLCVRRELGLPQPVCNVCGGVLMGDPDGAPGVCVHAAADECSPDREADAHHAPVPIIEKIPHWSCD